jgi:hypothetical protein
LLSRYTSVQASPCDDLRYSLAAGLPQSLSSVRWPIASKRSPLDAGEVFVRLEPVYDDLRCPVALILKRARPYRSHAPERGSGARKGT